MSTKDLILSRENVKRFSLGNVSETMSDSKMKLVLGGYGGYELDEVIINGNGTCALYDSSLGLRCNLSLAAVRGYLMDYPNANWCCDSCSTASWNTC